MADRRWTARLLSRPRSRTGWRTSAGVTQSALVGGLIVASLGITTGLVAYGPEVGSAVADRFICAIGSGDCGAGDDTAAATRPPERVLTQQAPTVGSYDIGGVKSPSPVSPGGSGYTYDGDALTFARCWTRVNELDYVTQVTVELCTTTDGTVYDCRSTQRTVLIPFPRSRNRCAPATEAALSDLVTCAPDPHGGQRCVAGTLDSVVRADGKTDNFYEDPSLEDLPGFQQYQKACRLDAAKCNKDLDRELADLLAKLKAVDAQYAECASALTNTQTELHTITDPITGAPKLLLRSDNGWVDPNDPNLDGATKAAVAYLLTGAIQRQVTFSTGTQRPAEQIPGMLAMAQAAGDALPNLAAPAGLSCQDISTALGRINDGTKGPGTVTGVADYCVQVDAGGACSAWGSQPLEQGEAGDPATQLGSGDNSIEVSTEAEKAASIDGIIPGQDDASYDEVVAYCSDHADQCQKRNAAHVAALQLQIFTDLKALGLCTSAQTCADFVEQTSAAAGACPAGGPGGWTARTLAVPNRAAIVAGSNGLIACGIIVGGLTAATVGGVPGAAAGGFLTALLVISGNMLARLEPPAAGAVDPRRFADVELAVAAAAHELGNVQDFLTRFVPQLSQQLHDIESQQPVETRNFFARVLDRVLGGHQD